MRIPVAIALLLPAPAAFAQITPLLEVNLKSGGEIRIDADQLDTDAALDAALGAALGEPTSTFSTRRLDGIVKKIVDGLRALRPRSPATLLVFVAPGRVNLDRLRRLQEVKVDLELVIDPCDRSVCEDSVATHIELVGRAVGSPEQEVGGKKLVFRTLTIRTATAFHDKETTDRLVQIEDAVAAAARPGGGRAWIEESRHQDERYEPLVSRAVARRAARRKVELDSAPVVTRANGEVQVQLKVLGDRTRTEELVLEALAAAVEGMRQNQATPAMQQVEIEFSQPGWKPRRFQAPGPSVGDWLDGKIEAKALWTTYVREIKKRQGASELDFSDEEG